MLLSKVVVCSAGNHKKKQSVRMGLGLRQEQRRKPVSLLSRVEKKPAAAIMARHFAAPVHVVDAHGIEQN